MSALTATDLFAGAGGSSTGMADVPGVEIAIAANHWKLAVDVHNSNHPSARHDCADISQVEPKRYPKTDLLWASPECTNHSVAQGRKRARQPDLFGQTLPEEAAERSRATMWDVPRFTEVHRYRAIVVENVVDAADWPPFTAWLMAMHSYGYDHHIVYLNSMHAQAAGLPAPQSRDRMYVVFWRRGERRPDFERFQRPKAYCPQCEETVDAVQSWKRTDRRWGRYRSQYLYRCPRVSCRNSVVEPGWLPAASAIDWSLEGTRIGDRPRPLAEKTRRRIAAGIARYWRPFITEHRHEYRVRDVQRPLQTLAASGNHFGLLVPVEGRDGKHARSTDDPMRTQTARHETALAWPFIAELRGGGSDARSTVDPLSTVTASGNHHALVTPSGGTWNEDAWEELRTLTTTGHQSVITPGDIEAAQAQVDDCLFRMLEPSEVAAGMAFPADYRWQGTRRERVKLSGNAVTPPAARDLMACVAEAITGEAVAP